MIPQFDEIFKQIEAKKSVDVNSRILIIDSL